MRLSSFLYRAARAARTGEAVGKSVEAGDPEYVERRLLNIVEGRALAKVRFWRFLWGSGRRER